MCLVRTFVHALPKCLTMKLFASGRFLKAKRKLEFNVKTNFTHSSRMAAFTAIEMIYYERTSRFRCYHEGVESICSSKPKHLWLNIAMHRYVVCFK